MKPSRPTVHIASIGDRHATAYESGLSNKTLEFRDTPRRVLIVDGDKTKLRAMMSETLQGQGVDVISFDEASHVTTTASTGTCTTSPEGYEAAAARERAAWNEAVDMRKAEKRMHRMERHWGVQ